jgi:hypothetical protein
MTGQAFRELALSLPDALESEHMGHPDFRVRGKIFASLNFDEDQGMVKLSLDDQESMVAGAPEVFVPCNGAWGKMGATYVRLAEARGATVKRALKAAWRNIAGEPESGKSRATAKPRRKR